MRATKFGSKSFGGGSPGIAVSLAFVFWLTGCGTLHPRKPLPAEHAGKASPVGYRDIRDWGDHFSPVLQRSVETALNRESAPDNPLGQTPIQYLSLSGGGMNGAFGAGFLCGWSEHGSRPTFDFVTGISAGALLSPFAFLGTNYDAALLEIYSNLQPKDLFRRKGLMRILRDDSAFDTTPLRKLLEKYVTKEMLAEIAREHARGRRLWIGTVNGTSDRNAKEKFTVVSPRAVLEKVAALPISEWNFKNEAAIRHIGPMAQDFHAAFSVGMDDKHIATVDEGGVALAAIQGLNQKVEEKNTEIANLKARLEKLEELLCHKPKGGTR